MRKAESKNIQVELDLLNRKARTVKNEMSYGITITINGAKLFIGEQLLKDIVNRHTHISGVGEVHYINKSVSDYLTETKSTEDKIEPILNEDRAFYLFAKELRSQAEIEVIIREIDQATEMSQLITIAQKLCWDAGAVLNFLTNNGVKELDAHSCYILINGEWSS